MKNKENLEKRIKANRSRHNARLRERYKLARDLGLTVSEAVIASQWSKKRIFGYLGAK